MTNWILGTGNWDGTNVANWSGAAVPTSADSVVFDANSNVGTGTFTTTIVTATALCNNLTISGLDGVMTLAGSAALNIGGNLTLTSANFSRTYTGTITFSATGAGKTISLGGVTLASAVTLNGVGGEWTLQDAFTTTGVVTLTAGAFRFGSAVLTASRYINTGAGVRIADWGTGNLVLTGNATTLYSDASGTNLTYAGTPRIDLTYAGATGTRLLQTTLFVEANAPRVRVLAGTDTVGFTGANVVGALDYTGFSGTASASAVTLYGNLTGTATMTWATGSNAYNFRATSGTQTIDVKNVAFNRPVVFNGVGGTFQLSSGLDLNGAAATLNNGTFAANGNTLKAGSFNSNNSNVRAIQFNTGAIEVTTTPFDVTTATNLTVGYSAGAQVRMTSASAKTFNGGGASWPKIVQGGAGDLTITGNNTFADISNLAAATSVLFTAGSTQTFSAFSLSGTPGNQLTIGSPTAAQHTLSMPSGTVNVTNTTISNSIATGGASWNAPTSAGNIDGGGNIGWNFGSKGAAGENNSYLPLLLC